MTAAILSGGENRRMPRIKGLLTVEGKTIVERGLEVLKNVFDRVVISTNSPELFFRFGVPLIGDIKKERGPLTGIFSVLAATGEDSVFIAACDMPYINEALVRYMVDSFKRHLAEGRAIDAVIPLFRGNAEPLFGIYTRACMKRMEEMFLDGQRGINELLRRSAALSITEEEIRRIDPGGKCFVNINTIEDYEKIGGTLCSV